MKRTTTSLLILFAASLLSSGASAATISFTGNLRTQATFNDCGPGCTLSPSVNTYEEYAQWAAVTLPFTVTVQSTMSAITFHYAGGVNGNGVSIDPSGFEPYLSLFDSAGSTFCPLKKRNFTS
jgi:hypothetical protein